MSQVEKLPRVFIVGDSISMQYGPYVEQYLTGQLQYARKTGESEAALSLDVPQGANGGDSSMVLSYLRGLQQANALHADVMLVNCGLHDIKVNPANGEYQVPLANYRSNLKEIVTVADRMGVEFVWITTTPCDESVHNAPGKVPPPDGTGRSFHRYSGDNNAYRAVAEGVMTAAGVRMIDLYTFTTRLGPELYCDHVHFNPAVRQLQAGFIAGWLIGRYATKWTAD